MTIHARPPENPNPNESITIEQSAPDPAVPDLHLVSDVEDAVVLPFSRPVAESGDGEPAPVRRSSQPSYSDIRLDAGVAARRLGLMDWQFNVAVNEGLIPPPTDNGTWLQSEIDPLWSYTGDIRAAVGSQPPLGANKCALRMAAALQVPVTRETILRLVAMGLLQPVGEWHGSPTYAVTDIDRICADHRNTVLALAVERERVLADTCAEKEALDALGWYRHELRAIAADRRIRVLPGGRYAWSDIERLLSDDDLHYRVLGVRELTSDEAARLLSIGQRSFDLCADAGWIDPISWVRQPDHTLAPIFLGEDVLELITLETIDWPAVQEAAPEPTPQLESEAAEAIRRMNAVRRSARDLTARHGIVAAAHYDTNASQWHVHWSLRDGAPTAATVRAELGSDPDLVEIIDVIILEPASAAEVRQWLPPSLSPQSSVPPKGMTNTLPSWAEVHDKLAARLAGSGAPSLRRVDAEVLAAQLCSRGVESIRMTDAEWYNYTADWWHNEYQVGTLEHIAALCGRLQDSVENRYAVNLTRKQGQALLDYLDADNTGLPQCVDL